MKWNTFTSSQDFSKIIDGAHELKFTNGNVLTNYKVVGVNVINNRGEQVNYKDIISFRPKKDFKRYNNLQKHFQVLENIDLDNLEYALADTLPEKYEEAKSLIESLNTLISEAHNQCITESKEFLYE